MKKPVRALLLLAFLAVVAVVLPGCGGQPPVTFVLAPPGPTDLGPATGLSTLPPDAVVFDLQYRPQTGGTGDIPYSGYWGYGGSDDQAKSNAFLSDVRKRASSLYYIQNPMFKGRDWAAVEYHGQQATALYFDLNADGKLAENERIPPTRKSDRGIEFITPDFMNPMQSGGEMLCRALVQVNFYGSSSEPNCLWSPAAVLEANGKLGGKPARLLIYPSGPGGGFNNYGSSSYALLLGASMGDRGGQYIPRERLSSLVSSEDQFYHLTIEGRRSNGLPARAVLVKDTSPTGALAVKLAGSNTLQSALTYLYLNGVDDKTVFFRVSTAKEKVPLPIGTYALSSGAIAYGTSNASAWDVSFSQGPSGQVTEGQVCEVTLAEPTLTVRAVDERNRYDRQAVGAASFKAGTRIYLEPRILGKGQEVFGRFRQSVAGRSDRVDRPPSVTISGPDGKQVLSSTMEYG